ncbi:hypothetical protein AB0O91_21085 [Kitasatospora sp. NPDC089797]|uniref:hypothetical protein n=1 Tax=Kitasatospora sp. NPDC089797 TaxID=3155298 RepID=UPI003423B467
MDQTDITRRLLGTILLAQGNEPASDGEDRVKLLLADLLNVDLQLPGDTTPQETAHAVVKALEPRFNGLVGAACVIVRVLAEAHDAGSTKSSQEVLREVALYLARDTQ